MEFTYTIENYYPYESRVFVVYTPVDTAFEPLGGWVYVTAEMTEAQIKSAIIAEAPLSKWSAPKSNAVLTLVGAEYAGTAVPPTAPPEYVASAEEVEARRIASLWQAAHDYESAQVSGSAIGLLTMGVMTSKPKCIAVQGWIKSIWSTYYERNSNGSTDYSFSFAGDCPHTVPELMQELGL